MLSGWSIILISFAYLGLLFAIAYYGDKSAQSNSRIASRPIIYSLSLAVYCSSWTFYGSVGRASTSGWEFLATYLGPVIVFTFGWRLMEKMVLISKQQNITTIADFISSRYGKSQALAVLVTVIAVAGTMPYIAMQLKAVAISYNALTPGTEDVISKGSDTALFVAIVMAIFAILFGTRHIDATEHHEGLVLAVAFESIVKLTAFLAVGIFVTLEVFEGFDDLAYNVATQLHNNSNYSSFLDDSFLTEILLACTAIICLPRQFHVTIVENTNSGHLKLARWLFPIYLILMAIFVLPIATAGMLYFDGTDVDADTFVLMLPLAADYKELATFAFIGGLSASTSMVIVASITLSTMVCNDIIMPLLFRISWLRLSDNKDVGALLLRVRRITIMCLMILAYFYYRILGEQSPLASFGLLAFVAAAQFFPAIIGGIYWKTGSRHGALAGLIGGFLLWLYTLVLPSFSEAGLLGPEYIENGIFGITWLTPTGLFGLHALDPLTHGVFWSLFVNTVLYVLVSRYTNPRLVDRIQASAFVDVYNKDLTESSRQYGQVTVGDLQMLTERFLGLSRTQHAFTGFALQRGEEPPLTGDKATPELIQFTERLLAGVIGASSARIVLASTLRGKDMHIGDVVTIVDEASQALRFNRSLLQSTIENISLGISVVDQQMRLVAWNRVYVEMFDYPEGLICIGRPIEEVFRFNAIKGEYGAGKHEEQVKKRLRVLKSGKRHSYERFRPNGTVLEVRGNPMPNGGYVNTYMDITDHKHVEEALRESEQNIRIYTDNVPVLIAYLDPERRYLFINKAYADTFDLDRNTISGKALYKIIPEDEYELRSPYIAEALKGIQQRFETTLPTMDGSIRYAEVKYIPHIGEYGDVLGCFTLYQDITERRKAEIALKETNETLEQRVRERTHALSVVNKELRKENTIRSLMEDELRQAKSDADDANIGKTRFLASASHDLLQPLNAARLFTSALAQQSQSQSSETNQLVENLNGSLTAAEELITAILDISKLDAGALEASISNFSMSDMLRALNTEFTAVAEKKNLKFHFVACNKIVKSDQQLLRRVIQNFLSNAIRYTQDGKILLGCRRRKNMLRIEVWDTGVGIAEDKLSEVFEEFRRIDNPRHSQVQGLGLGLAITERIAKMLGHKLNVRSWPTKGTVFSIEIPLGDPEKAVKQKPESRGWIRSKGLNGIRAIVIDNEPTILQGMSALLNGWGCEVLTALSAKEAIEKIQKEKFEPEIILADYHLSETLTGIMAINEIQPLLSDPAPAIVITADRTDEVKVEIRENNAQLLTKPIKPAALRAMINKTIATARAEKS
ncbi:NahK/ErcS family hybrid sensor histidine kinase/response regulator [Neptuniibacter sp. UBA847]|uniref:hybrid sensor histidine kinase/response regulator n=3 Tax=unclassified Neptuniibacter TaxID=2630693 RepID=UPI000C69EB4B|nr:NahK/ErcS family hybrid sensor histidine kinase/response regulator [Neptuniibacter sp. UBA847]MAY40967.1 hybrid sensor histidine kinase/response regulator [Oceanospirillaceae bacterium]|tara:strand:+ start:5725 stop:9669 length:3945 start_codon:yes stop_codon:yes gene_type:complete